MKVKDSDSFIVYFIFGLQVNILIKTMWKTVPLVMKKILKYSLTHCYGKDTEIITDPSSFEKKFHRVLKKILP